MIELSHKKLNVYQKSTEFVVEIYRLTDQFPKYELYGITSQLRRAVISIPSNISEGASRKSEKDRKRFYQIARSSLVELDTQIELSIKLKYLSKQDTKEAGLLANELFAMLSYMV